MTGVKITVRTTLANTVILAQNAVATTHPPPTHAMQGGTGWPTEEEQAHVRIKVVAHTPFQPRWSGHHIISAVVYNPWNCTRYVITHVIKANVCTHVHCRSASVITSTICQTLRIQLNHTRINRSSLSTHMGWSWMWQPHGSQSTLYNYNKTLIPQMKLKKE